MSFELPCWNRAEYLAIHTVYQSTMRVVVFHVEPLAILVEAPGVAECAKANYCNNYRVCQPSRSALCVLGPAESMIDEFAESLHARAKHRHVMIARGGDVLVSGAGLDV